MIAPPVPDWILHPGRNETLARDLARDLDAPLPAAHALVNRGLSTPELARRFLEPSLDHLNDPLRLKGLDRAVDRIRSAVERDEGILIHGDYDVDGVTSTFMLHSALGMLGARRVGYRIPHRTRDGYGLSNESVTHAKSGGYSLIVTVDCGIGAIEPVARAAEAGIDVIVTDHHEPSERLPDAAAVINPRVPGCEYPFKFLAGVGVAFKLVESLLEGRVPRERAHEFLDVVALGTIADVVPLIGENRVLARLGLDRLNRSPRPGLRALIDVVGLAGRTIGGGHVAFALAPRLNAAGRVGDAEQGVRLLLARQPEEARALAESLEENNALRRRYDEDALEEAAQRVADELDWPTCASIVLWSDRWHPGVIGIVAARLVERFRRPTLLVAMDGDRGRGSGRSLSGVDLNEVLGECSPLLESFGGHALAAGCTVWREHLPGLRERFERAVLSRATTESFRPRVSVDADLRLAECDRKLIEWLGRMAPHGLENSEPVFRASDLMVDRAGVVGDGRHLRLRVRDAGGSLDAIGFGMADRFTEVAEAGRCDLLFVPTLNEWMGESRVQLKLKGVRAP
jgi:single-stranded-DNA-specific exonuclease